MKKTLKRKNKTITWFFIRDSRIDVSQAGPEADIVSITDTKKEAFEYMEKRLFLDNAQHFEQWCSLRNYSMNENTWREYQIVSELDNPYRIYKTKILRSFVGSILRMFYNCQPIGCSYETLLESFTLAPEQMQKVVETIKNELEDNKKATKEDQQ